MRRFLPRITTGGTCMATSRGEHEGVYVELIWLGFVIALNFYGRIR